VVGGAAGNSGPGGADGPTGHYGIASAAVIDGTTRATPELQVGPLSLPAAVAGTPYQATLTVTGGVAPFEFRPFGLPGLPTALSTGKVTGTPVRAGVYQVQEYVRDSSAPDRLYGDRTVTLTVAPRSRSSHRRAGRPAPS
jgi:hypothetical protein